MKYTKVHPFILRIIELASQHDHILIDGFAGLGGVTEGFEQAGDFYVIACINHWKEAIETHEANHPNCLHLEEDFRTAYISLIVWMVNEIRKRNPDVRVHVWLSLECFPAGTLILTQRGLVDIVEVTKGDMVLTHKNRWRRVTGKIEKQAPTYNIQQHGALLETAGNHPLYTRERSWVWKNDIRRYRSEFAEPKWEITKNLKKNDSFLASPYFIPELPVPEVKGRGFEFSADFWWMIGRWLGDGSMSKRGDKHQITICCGKHEEEGLEEALSVFKPEGTKAGNSEMRFYKREVRTAYLFDGFHEGLSDWLLEHFGKGAVGKKLPSWIYSLSKEYKQALLRGYLSADGYLDEEDKLVSLSTVSKKLAIGLKLLIQDLGFVANFNKYKPHNNIIEGRVVNTQEFNYCVSFRYKLQVNYTMKDEHHIWGQVKNITPTNVVKTVYNISVEEDESYVADGVVVHNCTNFSIAKGGMSRNADSRTLADHADRYVEQIDPDVLWIENVKEFKLWGPMISKVCITGEKNKKQQLFFSWDRHDPHTFFNEYIEKGYYPYSPLVIKKPKLKKNKKTKEIIVVQPAEIAAWMIPDPEYKGRDYKRWCKHIESFGYDCHHRIMNMADYGVPQHRVRLIMQFPRSGMPVIYPEPTHDKYGRNDLPKWLAVKTCLDLEDEGDDVITFRVNKEGKKVWRIRSGKTIDRLIKGCQKHVLKKRESSWLVKPNSANNNTTVSSGSSLQHSSPAVTCFNGLNATTAFLAQAYSGDDASKVKSIEDPSRAITGTGGNLSLVTPHVLEDPFIVKFRSNNQKTGINSGASVHNESPTICAMPNLGFAKAHMLNLYYGNGGQDSPITNPCPTIPTKDRVMLDTVHYIDQYYSGGDQHKSIEDPAGCVSSVPKQRVVEVERFIDNQFGSGWQQSINETSPAIQANPKQNLVQVDHMVMDTQFNNESHDLEQPARTQTANRKHFYLVNFQWCNASFRSVEHASNTIIARMDKCPQYLMVLETGELAIEVNEDDPDYIVKLKRFMASNGILKISMRMLNKKELKRIMTIPVNYKMQGTETDQKKMIGNAVPSSFVTTLAKKYHKETKLKYAVA